MKKLISLFLAMVLCIGLLASVSLADDYPKPDECSPNQASIIVTHTGDPTAAYYFDTLTQALISWALQSLEGDTTIALTKDLDLEATSATTRFNIPSNTARWFGSNPGAKVLILDLGGHTLRNIGDCYLFRFERYGMTVMNGTIDYAGTRSVFVFGTTTGVTAVTAGTTLYRPVLNLENVHVYNAGVKTNSYAIQTHIHGSTINVKDSVLWSAVRPAISVGKTDQSERGSSVEYTDAYQVTVNVENSTVIGGENYPIDVTDKVDLTEDQLTISVKNSTLVSNASDGAAIDANDVSAFNTIGGQPAEQADWSLFLNNGTTATGTAFVYGVGSSAGKLPFTDVDENAWYYTYVRDLYNAKVIAGMTETTFVPEGTLTYGQALKLITLAVGEKEQAATDAHWASGYMNLAMGKGWLYNEVNLDGKISRLQFCQIAAAAAGIVEQPASNPFTDTQDGSVLALYNAGIINGMTETTFSPDSSLTRAQISKIIYGIIAR